MHCRRIILFMRCKQNIYLHKIFCHILFIFLLPDTNHQLWCKKFQIMFLLFSVIRELYNEHERPKLTFTLNFFVPRHHLIFSNFLYDPFSRSLSPPHWFSIQWRADDFKNTKTQKFNEQAVHHKRFFCGKGFDKKIFEGAFTTSGPKLVVSLCCKCVGWSLNSMRWREFQTWSRGIKCGHCANKVPWWRELQNCVEVQNYKI